MHLKALIASAIVCCLSATAHALPLVTGGIHDLLENTAGQVIAVMVSGGAGDTFAGADIGFTIEDGTFGPMMQAINMEIGTVFNGNHSGQGYLNNAFPERAELMAITTNSGEVGPSGVLAFITIDTTGLFVGDGPYDLHLTYLGNFPPELSPDFNSNTGDFPDFTDGLLNIVPEPGSVVLGLLAAAGLFAIAIRRRRRAA